MNEQDKQAFEAWCQFNRNLPYELQLDAWQAALEYARGKQEQVQPDDLRQAALIDLAYINGAKAGWNMCVADDESQFQKLTEGVAECVNVLKNTRSQATAQPVQPDYEEVLADHRRLIRELDVLINGEEGASSQASLCGIVSQVKRMGLSAQPVQPVVNEHELRVEIFTSLLGAMEEPVGERFDGRNVYRDLHELLKWVHEQRDESIAAIAAAEAAKGGSMKPTNEQLEQWWKIAFRRASAYCRYGHSIPEATARGMAKLAYREGYKAAEAAKGGV